MIQPMLTACLRFVAQKACRKLVGDLPIPCWFWATVIPIGVLLPNGGDPKLSVEKTNRTS